MWVHVFERRASKLLLLCAITDTGALFAIIIGIFSTKTRTKIIFFVPVKKCLVDPDIKDPNISSSL